MLNIFCFKLCVRCRLDFETTDEDSSRTLDPLRANDLEQVLKLIQAKNWTLGTFLYDLFSVPKIQKKDGNPQTQMQMGSIFLQGRSNIKAPDYRKNDVCESHRRLFVRQQTVQMKRRQHRGASSNGQYARWRRLWTVK